MTLSCIKTVSVFYPILHETNPVAEVSSLYTCGFKYTLWLQFENIHPFIITIDVPLVIIMCADISVKKPYQLQAWKNVQGMLKKTVETREKLQMYLNILDAIGINFLISQNLLKKQIRGKDIV